MRITPYTFTLTDDNIHKIKIDPPAKSKNYICSWVYLPSIDTGTLTAKIYISHTRYSSGTGNIRLIPVFSRPGHNIEVKLQTDSPPYTGTMLAYWDLIETWKPLIDSKIQIYQHPAEYNGQVACDPSFQTCERLTLVHNRTKRHYITLLGLIPLTAGNWHYHITAANHYVGEITGTIYQGSLKPPPYPLSAILPPLTKCSMEVTWTTPPGGIVHNDYFLYAYTSEKEGLPDLQKLRDMIGLRTSPHPMNFPQIPAPPPRRFPYKKLLVVNWPPSTSPKPQAPPLPAPPEAPRVPVKPDSRHDVSLKYPPAISLDVTPELTTPEDKATTLVTRPNETRVVAPMIGPYGMVRETADAFGRKRTSQTAFAYNADTINVNDTTPVTIHDGAPTHDVTLTAKAGRWQIQILSHNDLLSGKTISDVDTIDIEEGDHIEIPIEAVEVVATAPDASASVTCTLQHIETF